MKDNLEIVFLVVCFAFVGFRLYQKYYKKDELKPGSQKSPLLPSHPLQRMTITNLMLKNN